ncbi:hypothetical protein P245_15305 [Comamonas thiooxydans]|uniref:Uncharacterized protein n=1 Tax=Comamonas thiooxydans TaxID=363952 RepID=A0A0E3C188_9BURK|nr:hypothetical protein [Comamonas thiooxydans]KGG90831.1 hypothetical protein P245_15305 [Comamonas thiooxydans]
MSIQKEAAELSAVIGRMLFNTEMTLTIAPEFEGREADVKQAVEAELARFGNRALVELNGPLSLRASTFS